MAGDWIPRCKGLNRKPEILAIARAVGLHRRMVADILCDFWEWAHDAARDGTLPGLTIQELVSVVDDTDAAFWEAVCAVGWLEVTDRAIVIPKFDRWISLQAQQDLVDELRRSQEAARKRRNRKVSGTCPGHGGDTGACACPQNVRKMSASHADTEKEKGKEREERSPPTPPPKEEKEKQRERDLFPPPEAAARGASDPPTDPPRRPRPPRARPSAPRPRNDLWDAVVEVTGSDPRTSARHIGATCKALGEADPPYTPAEVRSLPAILAARGFTLPLTLGTVTKYARWAREQPPPAHRPRAETDAERLERIKREKGIP